MSGYDKSRLSEEILNDLADFESTGIDAIYVMAFSSQCSYVDIINRIQSSNLERIVFSGLRTDEEWNYSNSILKTVNLNIAPISNTKRYSSYALKESISSIGNLRYPLTTTFAGKNVLFAEKVFNKYNSLINSIKTHFDIDIEEINNRGELFLYKRQKPLFFFKISKENLYDKKNYKGKMIVNNNFTYNGVTYKLSQAEKMTRIFDAILQVSVDNYTNCELNKEKFSEGEKFISRLYAEILMSRSLNLGNKETNIKTEESLTLQLSNALAYLELDGDKINQCAHIGLEIAKSTIEILGFTIKDIKMSMENEGYKYDSNPNSIQEALFPIHIIKNQNTETEKPVKNVAEDKFTSKSIISIDVKQCLKLTKKGAGNYIDRVIVGEFTKKAENSRQDILSDKYQEKKTAYLKRVYNFIDHMQSYYIRHKDFSDKNEYIEAELKEENADNYVAHSYSDLFIQLKKYILVGIFKGEEYIEKKNDKAIPTIVNDFMEEKFNKKLAPFTKYVLNKNLKEIFEQIDKNEYSAKDIDALFEQVH